MTDKVQPGTQATPAPRNTDAEAAAAGRAAIRSNMVARAGYLLRLDHIDDGIDLDRAAAAHDVLHRAAAGRLGSLAGTQSETDFRASVLAKDPLDTAVWARLVRQDPAAAAPAWARLLTPAAVPFLANDQHHRAVLAEAGWALTPLGEEDGTMRAAAAALSREHGELQAMALEIDGTDDAHALDAFIDRAAAVQVRLSLVKTNAQRRRLSLIHPRRPQLAAS